MFLFLIVDKPRSMRAPTSLCACLLLALLGITATTATFNDPFTQVFEIVEESPNGTEVEGVSEYLQRSVGVGVQTTYLLLDSHEFLAPLLRIDLNTGRLFIEGRIDRETLCPQASGISSSYLNPDTSCVKQISVLASIPHTSQGEMPVKPIPLRC